MAAFVISALAFVALDWTLSATILAPPPAPNGRQNHSNCFARDSKRIFAFQPNCSCVRAWLKDTFPFATNNLGFRDAEVRDVPATDARPRLLLLGSSELEGMLPWKDSFAGRIASQFPQYDFLNAGTEGYSPSTYLTTARMVLNENIHIDEAIVFIDVADVQNEAAYFRDVGDDGAVLGPARREKINDRYGDLRLNISQHLLITDAVFDYLEHWAVQIGIYHLDQGHGGNEFDLVRSAWTYRPVPQTIPYEAGYGPLGVDGGIAKEKAKMDLLWEELKQRGIPLSVVVYPWPAQLVHDSENSRQVEIWRDWCAGKCKRFISVFPAFFAAKNSCPWDQPGCWYEKYFIFGDIHYNASGHAIVARVLSQNLEELPPTKVPTYDTSTGDANLSSKKPTQQHE